jgi:TRAP-type C4-dicarboxylate transport system permease small subunit
MTTSISAVSSTPGSGLALWTGVLGAPVVWAVQLDAGYALVPALCPSGNRTPLHLLSAVCIVLVLILCVLSYRTWRDSGGGSPDVPDGGWQARRRFVGALGMIVSLTFALVILAQGLAGFFFSPCWS